MGFYSPLVVWKRVGAPPVHLDSTTLVCVIFVTGAGSKHERSDNVTKQELESLAKRAHEVGRRAAERKWPSGGYDHEWDDIPQASRVGYVALVKFVLAEAKRMK